MSKTKPVPAGSAAKLREIQSRQMRDKAARAVSEIFRRTASDKELQAGHWMPASEEFWFSMFGENGIRKIKDATVSTGVVQENKRYCAGNNPAIREDTYPMSYRLADDYRTGDFELFSLARKPCKSTGYIDVDSLGDVGLALVDRLSLLTLPRNVSIQSKWDAYHAFEFRDGDISASRDPFGWRVHTTCTRLSKHVRRQLQAKTGQRLGRIDVKCCQPTVLAGHILLRTKREPPAKGGRELDRGHDTLDTICPLSLHPDNPPEELLPLGELPLGWMPSRFQRLCYESDLYEHFRVQLANGRCSEPFYVIGKKGKKKGQRWLCKPANWDRDRTKKAFVVALFGTITDMKSNPIYRLLQEDFPEIADWLLAEKLNPAFMDGFGIEDGYKTVAQVCQRIESLAMIDGVAAEFLEEFPNDPILTVHDEIIAPVGRLDWLIEQTRLEFAIRGVAVNVEKEIF